MSYLKKTFILNLFLLSVHIFYNFCSCIILIPAAMQSKEKWQLPKYTGREIKYVIPLHAVAHAVSAWLWEHDRDYKALLRTTDCCFLNSGFDTRHDKLKLRNPFHFSTRAWYLLTIYYLLVMQEAGLKKLDFRPVVPCQMLLSHARRRFLPCLFPYLDQARHFLPFSCPRILPTTILGTIQQLFPEKCSPSENNLSTYIGGRPWTGYMKSNLRMGHTSMVMLDLSLQTYPCVIYARMCVYLRRHFTFWMAEWVNAPILKWNHRTDAACCRCLLIFQESINLNSYRVSSWDPRIWGPLCWV